MPTFPNATNADWTQAQARLSRFARHQGLNHDAAAELAQAATVGLLTREYKDRTPYDPTEPGAVSLRVAIGWLINQGKRYGVRSMAPGNSTRRRRQRIGLEQSQPEAEPIAVIAKAPASANPATMAEAGEALAERMPRFAQRAKAEGKTPATLALIAAGFGPLDDEDAAKATPAVPQCGPGYTPPTGGCPGLHTDTDPGKRSPAPEPSPLEGENLATYRAELAAYYNR